MNDNKKYSPQKHIIIGNVRTPEIKGSEKF
jgi:hypothetical protein